MPGVYHSLHLSAWVQEYDKSQQREELYKKRETERKRQRQRGREQESEEEEDRRKGEINALWPQSLSSYTCSHAVMYFINIDWRAGMGLINPAGGDPVEEREIGRASCRERV